MAKMKKLAKFKSKEDEAGFLMRHDTSDFWDAFEDIKEPLDVTPTLMAEVRARHEKTKPISIRLYPSQLRMAKAIANKRHIPYQVILRDIIEFGLSRMAADKVVR